MILHWSHMISHWSHMILHWSHMILQWSHIILQWSHMILHWSHMILYWSHMILHWSHMTLHDLSLFKVAIALVLVPLLPLLKGEQAEEEDFGQVPPSPHLSWVLGDAKRWSIFFYHRCSHRRTTWLSLWKWWLVSKHRAIMDNIQPSHSYRHSHS